MTGPSSPIFLVAGGTGGHVMPAWVSAQVLYEQDIPCVLITDPRGQTFLRPHLDVGPLEVLPALSPFRGGLSSFRWLGGLVRQFICSLILLRRHKPRLVVGFGGYPSLAMGLAALCLRIPLWIHEQNAVLGRTNRLLSLWARHLLLTFTHTRKVLFPQRACVIGTPVRREVCERAAEEPPTPPPFAVLVLGGSQGARFWGELLPQALTLLDPKSRAHLHIIQQCRPDQEIALKERYQSLGVSHCVASYFPDVLERMGQAHALISRAGASTLSEWMVFGKPALFVPYPVATDDHQYENARQTCSHDPTRLLMVLESEISPELLCSVFQTWLSQPYASWKRKQTSFPLIHPKQTEKLWVSLVSGL